MFCRSCGENIPVDSIFCPNCGKNLLEMESASAPPSVPMAARLSRRGKARPATAPKWEIETEEEIEEQAEEEAGSSWGRWDLSTFEHLGFQRLFWFMGLSFATVGFVVGILGSLRTALVWILFGLVLIVAAPQAPAARRDSPPQSEEASD